MISFPLSYEARPDYPGCGVSLRVAVVHSFYGTAQPSGENSQVVSEVNALRRAGVDARLVAIHTDDAETERLYRVRAGLRVATGVGRSPLPALEELAPDVVHIHNLFPNFGRRWVRNVAVPTVVTLHNFRFSCAKGTLFRDGEMCTDCPDGDAWAGVRHRCYRGSAAATLPLAIAQRHGPASDPVLEHADRILCLAARQRELLVTSGVPADRLVQWANFLPEPIEPPHPLERSCPPPQGCLFVGRLSEEKGALDLVRAWDDHTMLKVVGDGPQLAKIRETAEGRRVEVLGPLPRQRVLDLMTESAVLIMPGGWPEGSNTPLVYLEALASGLPVVVRTVCDVSNRVANEGTGAVVDATADIPGAAARVAGDRSLRTRCRAVYEANYTEDTWVRRTIALYASLSSGTRRRKTRDYVLPAYSPPNPRDRQQTLNRHSSQGPPP